MSSREQFEAAVITRMKESGFREVEIRVECLGRSGDGYADGSIDAYWHFWNESRAAVVIEFPLRTPYVEYFEDVEGGSFDYPKYLSDVQAGIRAQGLKCEVKS